MLSPQTLERVSCSFRRGYYDGYFNRPHENAVPTTDNSIPLKPFSDFDYTEGRKAGHNDAFWETVRANRDAGLPA